MTTIEAVLFDLDDTLIDFQYSRRHGLRAVQELLPGLAPVPIEELELVHDEQLHANYLSTLDGSLSDDEARLERLRGICARYGLQPEEGRLPGRPRRTPASSSRTRVWCPAFPSCSRPCADG